MIHEPKILFFVEDMEDVCLRIAEGYPDGLKSRRGPKGGRPHNGNNREEHPSDSHHVNKSKSEQSLTVHIDDLPIPKEVKRRH